MVPAPRAWSVSIEPHIYQSLKNMRSILSIYDEVDVAGLAGPRVVQTRRHTPAHGPPRVAVQPIPQGPQQGIEV